MSVGVARLREEAERHPPRLHPQGRGPGPRRRGPPRGLGATRPAGQGRRPAQPAQDPLRLDRRGHQGRRGVQWPRGDPTARPVDLDGRRDQRPGRAPGRRHGASRRAAPAHPQPARPRHPRGWPGGQPHRAHLGRAAAPPGRRSRRACPPGCASRTGRSPSPWA